MKLMIEMCFESYNYKIKCLWISSIGYETNLQLPIIKKVKY